MFIQAETAHEMLVIFLDNGEYGPTSAQTPVAK